MKTKYILFISVVIGFCFYSRNTVKAQMAPGMPKVIPLAPIAAEFSKYGNYQVSSITGRPEISIPIYNIVSGSLKMPISLSYFAGGIKVSQVATWVGLGWSLNAGGVISRTVRGIPDETSTNGWIDDPTTAADLDYSSDADQLKTYADRIKDSAPDFFSYNLLNKSGRFIYRKSVQRFETIPLNPIKIVRTPGATDVNNNYQITDENGVKYYFNQKQNYSDDNIQETPAALRFYTQSWYLTKIVSANEKDSIVLRYEIKPVSTILPNGNSTNPEWLIQQTYTKIFYKTQVPSYPGGANYQDKGTVNEASSISTAEPTLKEIIFKNGKVVFNSITGRKDYPGAMLDDLTIYALTAGGSYTQIEKYAFNYDYFTSGQGVSQYDHRLKLMSLSKTDLNNIKSEVHLFDYNETQLPSTSSTAQDYWGFYNGREQQFLPNVPPNHSDLQQWYHNAPLGSADRSANDNTIQAGMLKKITYPTGGYTVFDFQPNKYKSNVIQTVTVTLIDNKLTGIGKNKPTTINHDFNWPADAITNNASVTIAFSPHTNPAAFDVAQKVTFKDLTTGSILGTWEHMGDFTVPYTINPGFVLDPTHNYRFTLLVDDNAPSSVSVKVTAEKRENVSLFKSGGGLRISKVANYDKDNSEIVSSNYTYSSQVGEGVGTFSRSDVDFDQNFYTKVEWTADPNCSNSPCECQLYQAHSIIYVGQGDIPQVSFEGSSVIYDQVVKIRTNPTGETNEKTVYNLVTPPNIGSIYNPNVPGGREYFNNNMREEGKLPSERYFSYDKVSGTYKLIGEKLYDYSPFQLDKEDAVNVYRIVFFSKWCQDPPNLASPTNFTHMKYPINLGSYKLNAITDRQYNPDDSVTEKVTQMFYDNPVHMQVTRTVTLRSDGKISTSVQTYPDDYAPGTPFIDKMKAANAIAIPIEEVTYLNEGLNATILKGTISQYRESNVGLVDKVYRFESAKPVALSQFKFSSKALGALPYGTTSGLYLFDDLYKERIKYNEYDNELNPLMITPTNGTPVSYQWGYNKIYPIVECWNAKNKNIFHQNFEETEGNSGLKDSYTGNVSKIGGYSRHIANLDNGNYILRYWAKVENKWVLKKTEIAVTSNVYDIEISNAYPIDDVSFYPADAQIVTYTYDPLIGRTSETDAKGLTIYYEYDSFQRLKYVKDQNGHIVKSYNYHYKS